MIYSLLMIFVSFFTMTPFTHAKVVGAWLFEEGETKINSVASGIVEDGSGNGHHGEIVGAVKWRVGKFGSALEFMPHPVDPEQEGWGYVRVEHHDDMNLNEFTLTAWVRVPTALEPLQMIVNKGLFFPEPWKTRNYSMWISSPADVIPASPKTAGHLGCGFYIGFPAPTYIGDFKTRSVTDRKWHFVACTYDALNLVGYVDGVAAGKEENKKIQGIRGKPTKTEYPLLIGAQADPMVRPEEVVDKADPDHLRGIRGISGIVDEVSLFDTALTADEIRSIEDLGLAARDDIRAVKPRGKLATTWAELKAQ